MQKILVLGGGFAGLWGAVGAVRKFDELGVQPNEFDVTLIDKNPYHAIRVRNYEEDLSEVTIPLADVLQPVGVKCIRGIVVAINTVSQVVEVATAAGQSYLEYDRLVLALGSQLNRPAIPGLAEDAFDVDTYAAAKRLESHLCDLAQQKPSPARNTVLVVGAGLTGLEVASEMPSKLQRLFGERFYRVILADSSSMVGPDLGDHARPVIEEALTSLGIEVRLNVAISGVDPRGVTLASGEFIPTATVIWCGGMRASPLTALIPVDQDRYGRLPVDDFMRVKGVRNLFAAGDCAWSLIDGAHQSMMSCQHGRPMGRFAGHNVAADLLGQPMLPLQIDWYTTVLDLGEWGGLYTLGWDRKLLSRGTPAKKTKQIINRQRIYPPRSRNREEILAAAAPIVPPAPARFPDEVKTEVTRAPSDAKA